MFLLVVHEEWSSGSRPRAIGFMLTLPRIIAPRRRGQCRTLMPRVRRPVASAPCLKDSWSDGPRAIGFMLTLPGGQCRTLLPRGPSPVVLLALCLLSCACSGSYNPAYTLHRMTLAPST